MTSPSIRTLTFGDRKISYNEDIEHHVSEDVEKDDESYASSVYTCSDMDSGVCEDVCCDQQRDNLDSEVMENHDSNENSTNERKIIKPDLIAIRELTNFDEVRMGTSYTVINICITG